MYKRQGQGTKQTERLAALLRLAGPLALAAQVTGGAKDDGAKDDGAQEQIATLARAAGEVLSAEEKKLFPGVLCKVSPPRFSFLGRRCRGDGRCAAKGWVVDCGKGALFIMHTFHRRIGLSSTQTCLLENTQRRRVAIAVPSHSSLPVPD